jgi:hypothetical protein
MRDNENRLGALPAADAPVAQMPVQAAQSTPLSFASPTEFVDLPSKGLLYPESHPLKGRTSIEMKFMTAKEEDILTSRSLIKKGVVIDKLLESLIVDKSVKVEQLLLSDKNALVIAARISGYGSEYKTSITCPNCNTVSKHAFELEGLKHKFCENPEDLGASLTDIGTYVFKLPKSGASVEIRPLYGADETAMTEAAEKRKKLNLPEEAATSQMKMFILSINNNRDKNFINSFVNGLPASDARLIRLMYRELIPVVDMNQLFVCSSCSYEQEMEVPFTVDFFWPK